MQKQRKIDRRRPSRDFFLALMAGITILTVVTVGFLYYQARLVGRIAQIPAFEFQLPVKLPFLTPPVEGSSFTDLFSGTAWLNATGTTLYHDFAMTTLSYPPKFEWEKLADKEAEKIKEKVSFVRLEEDGSDKRCLDNKCLVQRGLELFLNGQKISLPSELRTPELLNISIGATDKFWLLGGVVKDGGQYRGYVYKFNPIRNAISNGASGENFSRVFEDNDFLSP